jgi:hypothetical protein
VTEAQEQTRARNAENTGERRRRADDDGSIVTAKMSVPAGATDPSKYVYRWANDDGSRIHQLTVGDDWDFVTVTGGKGAEGGADTIKHRVGTKDDHSALYAYLLRKPKKFADEDKAKKAARISREETARLNELPSDAGDQTYKPGKA